MSATSAAGSSKYEEREEGRGKRQLSCAECHRLKLKCNMRDGEVPCSHCVRRGVQALCPNGVRVKRKASEQDSGVAELKDRLASLEALLAQALPHLVARAHTPPAPAGPKRRRPARDDASDGESSASPMSASHALSDARGGRELGGHGGHGGRNEHGGLRDHRDAPTRRGAGSHDSRAETALSPPRGRHGMFDYGSPGALPDSRVAGRRDAPRREDGFPGPARGHEVAHVGQAARRLSGEGHGQTGGPARDGMSRDRDEQGFGTLLIGRSGRSKWLGPTAGTEWLKDQEVSGTQTPVVEHSPLAPDDETPASTSASAAARNGSSALPFGRARRVHDGDFARHLPLVDEASALVDSYYRYYSWNHDVAPRRTFAAVFDRIYSSSSTAAPGADEPSGTAPATDPVHAQELALVFAILGMGALHNLDLPPNDPSADGYHALAEECLVAGDFLAHNTIVGVQALAIMAHYHLETDKGRTGDAAYPLWGLAMRIIVAMGLHRDGERWKLAPEVIEERRQVFWEVHTIDVFQANCFSRPSALRPEYIDTALPSQTWADGPTGVKAFRTLKYELCQISNAVLDQAMNVRASSYAAVTALYDRLCAFERSVPFELRCRTALVVLPSMYPDPEAAVANSPEVNRRNLHRTFQFQLSLNVSETILFLQRPYFARALQDHPGDPTHSVYGASYLAVLERCNVMIQIVAGLYELYPGVTARHWFFWYHLFTAAVCVGTLVITHPHNLLAAFALGQIDQAIALYQAVMALHRTPAAQHNLSWLVRLRARAVAKAAEPGEPSARGHGREREGDAQGEEDMALIGWRGRLIERGRGKGGALAQGGRVAEGLPAPTPVEGGGVGALGLEPGGAGQHVDGEANTATDQLLHQFWDPTVLGAAPGDGALASANWWSLDAGWPTAPAPPQGHPSQPSPGFPP